jgi:photosystem II stability/assembly factor-like uncharacterized protein
MATGLKILLFVLNPYVRIFKLYRLILVLTVFIVINIQISEAHRPHDTIFSAAISPNYEENMEIFCSVNHHMLHVLKSTNRGLTWQPSQNGLLNDTITTLAYSPSHITNSLIFAGTNTGDVYKSTSGSNWQLVNKGLPTSKITSIVFSPNFSGDNIFFIGLKDSGIYKTVDGGVNFIPSNNGLTNLKVNTILISPNFSQDQNIFVGTEGGLFKSLDGGTSWLPANTGLNYLNITALCISPNYSTDRTIFAGTYGGGIYKTLNGGNFWLETNNGITDLYVTAMALSPGFLYDKTLIAASKDTGVFISEDGGISWGLFDRGLEERTNQYDVHFFNLLFSPNYEHDHTLFAGMFEGLFKSEDNGNSWYQMNVYQPQLSRSVSVSPHYFTENHVLYGTYGGGIYASNNGGNSWKPMNSGLKSPFIFPISYAPDNTIFAVGTGFEGDPSRLYRSINNGASWTNTLIAPQDNFLPTVHGFALSPDFINDKTLFLGNRSNGSYALFRSTDEGNSFNPVNLEVETVFSIAISNEFAVDNKLYVGTERGVFKSFDRGESWVFSGLNNMTIYSLEISKDGTLFAGTLGQGVFRSLEGGENWYPANSGLSDLTITAICTSPIYQNDRTVFITTLGSGIFKSVDAGANWQHSGLNGNYIQGLSISPAFEHDQTVFAATWDGVYKSVDGGDNWEFVSTIIRYEEYFDSIVFEGTWHTRKHPRLSTSALAYSLLAGNSFTLSFWGTAIRWIGTKGNDHGVALIYLDGIYQESIDLYSAQLGVNRPLYVKRGLPTGTHTLTVVVDPSISGKYVTLDGLDVGLSMPND